MSSEILPQYSHSSDRLPPYSRFPEAPTSKPLPSHYVMQSRRMVLDLGQRYQSTAVPAFGREGLVEGHVWVQSFKNVEKIQVTLTGAIVSCFLEFGVPSRRSIKRLIHQTAEIWSAADQDPNANQTEQSLAFALVFPEYVNGTERDSAGPALLPPSASIVIPGAAAHVAYIVRVDMFRKGWRSHDTIKTEILYLPRTITHYSRPYLPLPNSEKPRPIPVEEWAIALVPPMSETTSSNPKPKAISSNPKAKATSSNLKSEIKSQSHSSLPQCVGDDIIVRLWLPDGLRYPAGRQILWGVSFVFPRARISNDPTSGVIGYDFDALAAGISLRLVRVSTVGVRGAVSCRELVVATGEVFSIVPDAVTDLGEKMLRVRGCLQSGEAERDMSWGVSGFASVAYEIRVSVKPDNRVGQEMPVWEYSERISITSHEANGEMHNAGVPALLLPGATREPALLDLMDL